MKRFNEYENKEELKKELEFFKDNLIGENQSNLFKIRVINLEDNERKLDKTNMFLSIL